ncbi:3-ketosteroid 9alpha-monooxygenase subunit A [Thermomonospora echinospora]|uniref:Rieske-type oxygenase n=1 Tax=Thermomonospora echinospora TaxID=1992 RepID=A0A1H6DU55_9ACTN|nr:3-ketosteroid 9alpha-monooxygenase subunit A [Thermomonospora echinospora]
MNVLDAYCRHMGGDLSRGEVKGDEIACPFHDWRWSGNGRCVRIPYSRRVPPRARTRSWMTLERNAQLYVWHDPQGGPPPPEVTIPEIAEVGSGEWTSFTWNRLLIEGSHCREIVDNVVDMAHFFYVHYSFPTYFKNVFEGHIASQYMNGRSRPDVDLGTHYSGEERVSVSQASYYGPSYMINPMRSTGGQGTLESILINCHYPVSPTSFVLQWGVMVKRPAGVSMQEAEQYAQGFAAGVEKGFLQDVQIWRNKAKIDNPLLCEEDGPVYQLRRWYEQFYVDVEDVTPQMTQRFECEIDTERAKEFWQKQVEENLAAGRTVGLEPETAEAKD